MFHALKEIALDNEVLRVKQIVFWKIFDMMDIVRLEDLAKPSPFYIKPKVHTEKEETSEDEQGRPKLLRGAIEDHPILGQPRSLRGKAAHSQRQPS